MKNRKKGFTIVELVIVIAVIAILAAVLIPTFSDLIKKANRNADMQLVRNLNTAVVMDLAEKNITKHATAHDAVLACEANGYLVARIVAKSDYDIAYSLNDGRFVLINTETGEISYPAAGEITTTSVTTANEKVNYFIVRSEMPTKENEKDYSVYAGVNWKDENPALNGVGFDAGYNTNIKTVAYTNTSNDDRDVVIRTNSFSTVMTINGPQDTVKHYDYAAKVVVEHIKDSSYDEYGTVGRI